MQLTMTDADDGSVNDCDNVAVDVTELLLLMFFVGDHIGRAAGDDVGLVLEEVPGVVVGDTVGHMAGIAVGDVDINDTIDDVAGASIGSQQRRCCCDV